MIDYHMHSALSGDSDAPFMDMCRAAAERGLSEICFTEHVDFEPTDPCFGWFDYSKYKGLVEQAQEIYAGRMIIRRGAEIDYQVKYDQQVRDFLRNNDFDYVVGSAHYVDGILLEEHERYFPGKAAEEAYTPYFENTLAAVKTGCFDTLAHLDLCKRYGVRYFGRFDWSPYRERIVEILQVVIDSGMTLEINTSGLRQSPMDTYPSRDIIELYYNLGGRNIVVGSDAHKPDDVGSGIDEVYQMAEEIGFCDVNCYCCRQITKHRIGELFTHSG